MKSMMVARSAVTVAPGAEWPASIGARSEWRGVTSDRKPRQLPAIPCVPLFSHSSPLTPLHSLLAPILAGHSAPGATVTADLATIIDFIRYGASRFSAAGLTFGHSHDNPIDEATHLVLASLHLPPDIPPAY